MVLRGLRRWAGIVTVVAIASAGITAATGGDADAATGIPASWSRICPGRVASAGTPMVAGAANCRTIDAGGLRRRFVAYVPSAAATGAALPVVFMFHGSGGNGEQFYDISGWREVAEQEGFIAVFPTGATYTIVDTGRRSTKWHDFGLACEVSQRPRSWPAGAAYPADDGAFVDEMLADLGVSSDVDDTRVYASGFSNGSAFAQTLAITHADVFAAIGSWAGPSGPCLDANGVPVETITPPHLQDPPQTAIPVALGLGTEDPKFVDGVNAYLVSIGEPTITEFPLDPASMERYLGWVFRRAQASLGLEHVAGTPIAVADWAGVAWRATWPAPQYTTLQWTQPVAGNAAGNSYTFMLLDGVKHHYPNATPGKATRITASASVHAATLFWQFFERHQR